MTGSFILRRARWLAFLLTLAAVAPVTFALEATPVPAVPAAPAPAATAPGIVTLPAVAVAENAITSCPEFGAVNPIATGCFVSLKVSNTHCGSRRVRSVPFWAAVASSAAVAELAAWTSVARTILNLHETITRY